VGNQVPFGIAVATREGKPVFTPLRIADLPAAISTNSLSGLQTHQIEIGDYGVQHARVISFLKGKT
jgi:hypothetical protein